MDSPLHAMVFAEDLIAHFLDKSGLEINWFRIRPHREEIGKPRLTPQVIAAVTCLTDENYLTIESSFKKLHDELKTVEKDDIRVELTITAVYHFRNGYSHLAMLQMCALLVGLSVLYGKEGNLAFADVATQMLAYIINFYIYMLVFDPRSGWFELACTSQHLMRRMNYSRDNLGTSSNKK